MADPIRELFSQTSYDTDGTTTVWNFSFAGGYIDRAHVFVQLLAKDTGITTPVPITNANFVGDFQLQLTPAFPVGSELTIYRDTPKDLPLVNFADRAALTEAALDLQARQSIFVAAESSDQLSASLDSVSQVSQLVDNAMGFAATAAAAAIAANSSAGLAATSASTAASSSAAAASSASTASGAASNAIGAANTALTHVNSAADARDLARDYRDAAALSASAAAAQASGALTQALAAAGSATAAAGSATTAQGHATTAGNSATAAAGSATTAQGHATAASGSATTATTQAGTATTQAGIATTQAGIATTQATNAANSAIAAANVLRGRCNFLLNGGFDVWQLGTNLQVTGHLQKMADRWNYDYNGTIGTVFVTRSSVAMAAFGNSVYSPKWCARLQCTVAPTGNTFQDFSSQIEGVRTLQGRQVTISFYAFCQGTAKPIIVKTEQYFGGGGSPSAPVFNTSAPITIASGVWARYSATFTLASVTGKTIGNNADDTLNVILSLPINQVFDFFIAGVQIEAGPVATAFEERPYAEIYADCQRYLQTSYDDGVTPGTVTSVGATGTNRTTGASIFAVPLKVPMRLGPAVRYFNPVTGALGTWNAAGTAIAVSTNTNGSNNLTVAIPAGAATFVSGHYVAEDPFY